MAITKWSIQTQKRLPVSEGEWPELAHKLPPSRHSISARISASGSPLREDLKD
jgi:hypothetical protein